MELRVAITSLFIIAVGALPSMAKAAVYKISGSLDGHAGYGKNPLLSSLDIGSSTLFGVEITGTLDRETSRARTTFWSRVAVDHYAVHSGVVRSVSSKIQHSQQISQFISISGSLTYEDSVNPHVSYSTKSADLVFNVDPIGVGQRTRTITGIADLTWEPSSRDLFQAGFNKTRASFEGITANSYSQSGGSLGYLRTVSAYTKVGIQGGTSEVGTPRNPKMRSDVIGAQIVQRLGPIWRFEAGSSLISQHLSIGTKRTIGFNGTLCATYPRIDVCFLASRVSAANGASGLRIDTQVGSRLNYKPTIKSSIAMSVTYDVSALEHKSSPKLYYLDTAISYRRDIRPRMQIGLSGRLQRRDYGESSFFGERLISYSTTADVIWKFGREKM